MFRIKITPGRGNGFPVILVDYADCGGGKTEAVKEFVLRNAPTASKQREFAAQLSEFTGYDVMDNKGQVINLDSYIPEEAA